MITGGICVKCSLLLLALPLFVEGGFPKAAKTTLNLTVNAKSQSRSGQAFTDYGKLVLALRRGAKITFRGTISGNCEPDKKASLFYWLITSDCVGVIDNTNDSVLVNPQHKLLRQVTSRILDPLPCNGDHPIHPKNMTKEWHDVGSAWNSLCGADVKNSTVVTAKATTTPVTTEARRNSGAPAGKNTKNSVATSLTKTEQTKTTNGPTVSTTSAPKETIGQTTRAQRRKRGADPTTALAATSSSGRAKSSKKSYSSVVCKTRTNDIHGLIFMASLPKDSASTDEVNLQITVEMKNEWGYLSAVDHPNLAFYGVMTGLYSILAFIWLVMLMVQYRDLLRIQFWIGGVIGLGMIEKALFLAEYNAVNENGNESAGLMVLAELVSTGKRTLARLLVIIVSMGFGIVKPRLGPMLPRVLAVGVLYFVAGTVDSTSRALHNSETTKERQDLATTLVLTVVDVGICWWIFLSLHSTMRTLRLRRNLVKLSLYRHFTNTLVFSVVASVAFMVWDLRQFRLTECITDWSELWLRSGFWHILFSFILIIIMILWRPTANNNRYAYSPLIDLGSNEEPEQAPSDAFEGMKLRTIGGQGEKKAPRSVDDDLKWVEENIPTAAAESALPSLLDSDEELMTTKFEMSKIQ